MSSSVKRVTISLPQNLVLEGKNYAIHNGATFSGLLRVLLESRLKIANHGDETHENEER